MKKYGMVRKLSADDVRDLCISKKWYTRGDNTAYQQILGRISDLQDRDESITVQELAEIAGDILQHSETVYTMEAVIWELDRICYTRVFEVH